MNNARFGPFELPASVWRRSEARAALQTRDVAALLRLVQQYGGASQARIATATGLGQGRVNEIINGRRRVTRLDVFERIAEGLGLPDDARALLGLAPVHAAARGILTGHAEIARVFGSQAEVDVELREQAGTATHVDVLAVRALGLLALNDSLLRGPLSQRETPVTVRVLLLDPDSHATAVRAEEIGESAESFAAGIRLALSRLAEFSSHPQVRLECRVYGSLPTWRMMRFDGTLYLSAFGSSFEGHRSGVYKLTAAVAGVLHTGFRRQFDDMWCHARRSGGEGQAG